MAWIYGRLHVNFWGTEFFCIFDRQTPPLMADHISSKLPTPYTTMLLKETNNPRLLTLSLSFPIDDFPNTERDERALKSTLM